MARSKSSAELSEMTPEEERAYWDTQDPLRQDKKVRVQHPEPPEGRLSYFALRLSGKDITRLADLAKKRGMKPSELARLFIVHGLEQEEDEQSLGKLVRQLETEINDIKRRLSEVTTLSPPSS